MLRIFLLILLPILFILLSLFNKKDSFFDLIDVIKSHMMLFRKCKQFYFTFYICPAWLSVGISFYYKPTELFYENMLVVISIILAVLFSMSGIIISRKVIEDNEQIKNVIKETHNSILFSVILSVGIMLAIIIGICVDCNDIITRFIGGLIFYLFQVVLLTVLVIIKRIGKLMDC